MFTSPGFAFAIIPMDTSGRLDRADRSQCRLGVPRYIPQVFATYLGVFDKEKVREPRKEICSNPGVEKKVRVEKVEVVVKLVA